ncbi:MAG TPA: FG-GAP-like repeat-containing protein, partial [Terriglobia bacterium]|nr:FG-GAP-like repeat-containing protein [Terriglobia bacterium]
MRHSLPRYTLGIILTLIGSGFLTATVQAQNYVFNQATFTVGNSPQSIAVGDFNGDGKPDLAVVNSYDGTVSILLGKADATFLPHVDYALGSMSQVYSVVAGDFNGDRRLDLAVTLSTGLSYEVAILLGNGDGTFTKPAILTLDGFPRGIVVGDFNNDGKIDLGFAEATGGGGTGVAALLLGNGDGTFQPSNDFPLPGAPSMVAAADLNNDGNLDLIVAGGTSNTFSVLLGNGNGTFQPYVNYSTSGAVNQLVVVDLNGDNKPDLVVPATAYGQTGFWIFLGLGDGTFQAPVNVTAGGNTVATLAAGDFNGDGKLDLVFTTSTYQAAVTDVLLGNGDGTFPSQPILAGAAASVLATGDFNGDGKLDLAYIPAPYYGIDSIGIMLGNGDGTFSLRTDYATAASPMAAVAGDFNGDGKPDLAVPINNGQFNPGAVSVFINNGDGTFQPPVNYSIGNPPQAIVAGDFNGDGIPDLAVVNTGNPQQSVVSILLGNGNGTFQAHVDFAVGMAGVSLVAGDFNGDGRLDLAVAGGVYNSSTGSQGAIALLLGNGNGTIQAPVIVTVPNTMYSLDGLATGDFNHDGRLDLAATDGVNHLYVLLGNGDGTFTAPVTYTTSAAGALAAADFNGDGNVDLAAPEWQGYSIGVMLGNGDGTFQTAVPYSAGDIGNSLIAADFNGDGKPDLVSGGTILLNNGDGTFGPPYNFPAANMELYGVAAADFNSDGAADLVLASAYNSTTVSVYLSHPVIALYPPKVVFANQGEGTTSPAQTVSVSNPGSAPFSLTSIGATPPFAESTTCGATIAPGTNCPINVTFSPSGTGELNGILTLADSALGSPQFTPLAGLSVSGAAATLSPAAMSFDGLPVGQTSAAVTATLQNTGNALMSGIGIVATGDFTQTNTCGSSLGLGAACTISVNFVPLARGVRNGSITVTSNAGQSAISLAGIGLAAVLSLSTNSLDFGTQYVGIAGGWGSAVVTSAGDLTLNLTGISASGDFSQTNDCNQPLAPGSFCYVSVSVTPSAVGTRTGTLTFTDNGVGTQPSVALTATAVYAVPQIVAPIAPASAPPGSAGFTLTVNGSGFAPVSVVQWKGSPRPTTYVSPTQLTAAIPASDVAAAGTAVVTVFNPTPGGGTSNGSAFEITTATPTLAFVNTNLTVGQQPLVVAGGDFNGDGKPDLVIANITSNTISVLLGNGDGTFRPHVDYAAGSGPESVVVADVNNDGKLDLAVLDQNTATTSVLLGNGDGTFRSPLSITGFNLNGSGIAAGDFNGDGKVDLAV